MKIFTRFALVLSLGALGSVVYAQCPAYGVASDCTTLMTVGSGGTLNVVAGPGGLTYDGSDDQLVGFTNNTSGSISSITLNGNGQDIFGFDGDGIDAYGAPGNTMDNTGYGGPNAYFTNYLADDTMGTVNFVSPIAPGGFAYFSLEEPFSASTPITGTPGGPTGVTPEPGTLMLFGTGALGLAVRFRSRFSRTAK
jgi:hypothetical protein